MAPVNEPFLVPIKPLVVDENSHQFGYDQRRVSLVKMDKHLVGQRIPAVVRLPEAAENVLER